MYIKAVSFQVEGLNIIQLLSSRYSNIKFIFLTYIKLYKLVVRSKLKLSENKPIAIFVIWGWR